ncbi:CGNR zinc finger domain-containing protein [Streptomyces sp. NPDC092129]|uniref:CGNR zinc finger domain-containing protein n=1 Tax=Streptomyces sp. NPDC092129 TaxID=3366010 RepID=UPI003823D240
MGVRVSVEAMQGAGFPMGGEPLVAVDLADTVMTAVRPTEDLIASAEAAEKWWQLEASGLPAGPMPDPSALRRLRTAVRDLLDAQLEGREADSTALEDLNAAAAGAPTSPRLVMTPKGLQGERRWHTELGGNAALAAIAGEAITLLADPQRLSTLRRCANPACSMLFLAENKGRKWCTGNLCGNRARVARHYERTHRERSADA